MKIKDLCCDEQPREKLLAKGPSALANAELLAILLRTGDSNHNVVDLCRDLLKQAEEKLCLLSDWSIEGLQSISGIGPAKALTISAAFELARRWAVEKSGLQTRPISKSSDAYALIGPRLRALSHEESWIILLNRSNIAVSVERLSSGSLTETALDTRSIIKRALDKNASGVILAHNHPSGNPHPGHADLVCTGKVKNALESFDISLLDHLVICNDLWYSFSDEEVHSPAAHRDQDQPKAPCGDGRSEC